ncbi:MULTISPECIES: DUF2784 domain-containing protein [unclassified Wenzhouxiangella]|uniref:DUF2784 domain-containing protein n=1 Tax=unclassified Wenzhouxiangella TaxID=2613841 RepID=UPI000E326AA8|nr:MULTISPECIES: DUF2784 domain-containing protein [unclassified Wenzhouxiangella]RFF26692.1 DUF2784 domain-containing protein [Wenzhouxiangella sp. 15181]RFP69338.1 DUF2784 domain-containing protein [Wenzhouxiangella sp. 15190]
MSREFLHSLPYPGLLADAILVIHALFVAFVIGGQVAVMVGWVRGWVWVRNPWFRGIHLVVIAYIVGQTWLGRLCPLTVWEGELRRAAGQEHYGESFIGYWLGELLFLDLSWSTFLVIYTAFGTLVAVSWVHFPPRRRRRQERSPGRDD